MPVRRSSEERRERDEIRDNEDRFLQQIQGIRENERAAQVIQGHEQNIARMQADLQRHAVVNRALRAELNRNAPPGLQRQRPINANQLAQIEEAVQQFEEEQAARAVARAAQQEAAVRAASAKSSGTRVTTKSATGVQPSKRRRSPQGSNDSTQSDATSKFQKHTTGGATHIHNGRSYKVHTGSQGGKYIVSKGQKIYV